MGILDIASGESIYRGYEYFSDGKVLSCVKTDDSIYDGLVQGSANKPYTVHLNFDKIRSSSCDCPFATGRRICKHMIALFFTAFPEEAKRYKERLDAYYEDEFSDEDELDDAVLDCLNQMTKSELKSALYRILYDGPEWQFERFVREYTDAEYY